MKRTPVATPTPASSQIVLIAGGDNDGFPPILDTAELFHPGSGVFTCVGGLSGAACNRSMTDARENEALPDLSDVSDSSPQLANGKVLFAGGTDNVSTLPLNTAELYDPVSSTFVCVGSVSSMPPLCNSSMTDVRYTHTTTLLNPNVVSGPQAGFALIAGGDDLSNPTIGTPLRTAELYDPTTGKFICVGGVSSAPPRCNSSMSAPRREHAAVLLTTGPLKGQVLVVGGNNHTGILNSAELYNPATGKFKATGSMTEGRVAPTATELKNGMVLVAGGESGLTGGPSQTAELYDPTTQTFSCVGGTLGGGGFACSTSMVDSRQYFTATLLPSGKVLLAGGFDSAGNWVASTELFDPDSKTFSFAGNMTSPRGAHSATLITGGPDAGQVLLAGGENNSGDILATAELYNATTGKFTCVGGVSSTPPRCKASLHSRRRDHYAVLVSVGAASLISTPAPTRTPTPTP